MRPPSPPARSAAAMVFRYAINPLRWEYISPGVEAITGYPPQAFYDNPRLGLDIVHPADRDVIAAVLAKPESAPQRLLVRWHHRGGRDVWTEHFRVRVEDSQGRVVAIEGIARDVTDLFGGSDRDRVAPQGVLSKRELQVLGLIGSGRTVSEIAEVLDLSVKTVSTYRTRMLEKLGLRTTAELTRYAIRRGLDLWSLPLVGWI